MMAAKHAWDADMGLRVMGLSFRDPLGLAAGFDRSGARAAELVKLGFGHIEIGTVAPGQAVSVNQPRRQWRLGINIGSPREGMNSLVVEDYLTALRLAYQSADYLCVNLSSPFAGRDAYSIGVDGLIARLKREGETCTNRTRRRVPLLLKIEGAGDSSNPPAAISAARHHGLDGLVLVSRQLNYIEQICRYLDGLTVISVGGVESAEDVKARLASGAALVQIFGFFERHGAEGLRRLLGELNDR